MNRTRLTMYAAAAAVLVFLGCILPWVTLSFPPETAAFTEVQGIHIKTSANGFDFSKGTWILILSLLGGSAAALVWKKMTGIVPLHPQQLLLTGAGTYGLAAVLTLTEVLSSRGPMASNGIGIYLTFLAAAAGAACCVLALKKPDAAV